MLGRSAGDRLFGVAGGLALAAALLFVVVPALVVALASVNPTAILTFPPEGVSLRWYANAVGYPQFRRAAWNSVVVTLAATAFSVPIGVAAALGLGRLPGRLRAAAGTALLAPLVVPGVVLGLGLLFLGAGVGAHGTLAWTVVAHLIVVLPFVVRAVYVSLEKLDPRLAMAAESLGARPPAVLRHVTLPGLMPGIVAAVVFALVLSLNEFVVSLFLGTRTTEILPVAMYTYINNYTDPTIAAVSTAYILSTLVAILVADRIVALDTIFGVGGRT